MYSGNREVSQYMMRGRVFFQGFTIGCLIISGYLIFIRACTTILNDIDFIRYNIVNKYKLAVDNETKKREALNE
jgi:hypothetical protein